ncbi:MAG: adenylyltransferase/cytidyltransferase family protein [Phycisphaerales bacterium]
MVCLEDYNKGVCTPELCQAVITRAKAAGKPVFVDPAGIADYTKYRGATAIDAQPHRGRSVPGITAHDASVDHAARLGVACSTTSRAEAVVLTLDRKGSRCVRRDSDDAVPVPTVAREVPTLRARATCDARGLAAARLVNGVDWESSVRFATRPGLEVEVFGVAPIPLERVHAELLNLHTPPGGQAHDRRAGWCRSPARQGGQSRVVFTNGCFDVLHAGHVSLLERAAAFGLFLIVALNDDLSASSRARRSRQRPGAAGPRAGKAVLNAVNAVVMFGDPTPSA